MINLANFSSFLILKAQNTTAEHFARIQTDQNFSGASWATKKKFSIAQAKTSVPRIHVKNLNQLRQEIRTLK